MLIAILIILSVFAIIGWLKYKLTTAVLSAWIAEKDCPLPDDEDVRRLTKQVIKKGKTR